MSSQVWALGSEADCLVKPSSSLANEWGWGEFLSCSGSLSVNGVVAPAPKAVGRTSLRDTGGELRWVAGAARVREGAGVSVLAAVGCSEHHLRSELREDAAGSGRLGGK